MTASIPLPSFLEEPLHRAFLKELLSTPTGRATMLLELATAEGGDGGELDIFEHVLALIDDDELRKLVRVHKADEERHEQLFLARARAQGAAPLSLPKQANLLHRLDDKLGFFSRPIVDRDGVLEAYLLMLVIEERAIRQFGKMKRAFLDVGDADSAALFDLIGADEVRHLKYCHAISKRYAPSEVERLARLDEMRALEERCFQEAQAIHLRFYVDKGLVGGGALGVLFRGLKAVAERRFPEPIVEREPAAHAAPTSQAAHAVAA